jgi:hypothetical protein
MIVLAIVGSAVLLVLVVGGVGFFASELNVRG